LPTLSTLADDEICQPSLIFVIKAAPLSSILTVW
jgi:hypothetical protein